MVFEAAENPGQAFFNLLWRKGARITDGGGIDEQEQTFAVDIDIAVAAVLSADVDRRLRGQRQVIKNLSELRAVIGREKNIVAA